MFSSELFPVICGLVVGGILGFVRPSLRVWIGALLAVGCGVLATAVSGEFEISWAFILIDIPLVAMAAVVSLLAARRLRIATMKNA